MGGEARESLARCDGCGWAGLYTVQAVVVGAYARVARGPAPTNACPRCAAGEVRCALNLDEEREAIRQELAVVFGNIDVLATHDGKVAVVVKRGSGVPRVVTLDVGAVQRDPRATLEQLIVGVQSDAGAGPPRAPYR